MKSNLENIISNVKKCYKESILIENNKLPDYFIINNIGYGNNLDTNNIMDIHNYLILKFH
jgi:hypothetical protein